MKSDHQAVPRRTFLADMGMGFTGLVLGTMLARDGRVRAEDSIGVGPWTPPDGKPHFTPRAKNVIWLFMIGGTSHLESFDPKPALNRYAGKTYAQTPFQNILDSPHLKANLRELVKGLHNSRNTLFPLQIGYRPRGQSGIEVSDWWPHVGECIDEIAVIRSMWTTDNDHGAQLQFHTGRHMLEGQFPTIGSWVHYGLGTLNEDLPRFVVLGTPIADCCGGHGRPWGKLSWSRTRWRPACRRPQEPAAICRAGPEVYRDEQEREFALLGRLNRLSAVKYPDDPALRARIKSYELAFRMQMAVPEVLQFAEEPNHLQRLYGLDHDTTRPFGQTCLTARRLVERGVRFVQVFHGSNGGAGNWDSHSGLRQHHAAQSAQVDRPIAGLLQDLKQRGLLDETIVVWATEFGRTPGAREAMAATTTLMAFRSGWPAAGSRGASSTVQPTSLGSTPSKIATTSPTSTPPSSTNSASIPTALKFPATSGSKSISAGRSPRS